MIHQMIVLAIGVVLVTSTVLVTLVLLSCNDRDQHGRTDE